MSQRFGLYLHIPFCKSKCSYCDFPSYPHMDKWQEAIVERMCEELAESGEKLNHRVPTTVYVGGGTPSILKPELFLKLMTRARQCFPWNDDAEVSVEMNPGTVTAQFLDAARQSGVNRVSMGAQSADDRLLKSLGRIHNAADIVQTVNMLKEYGFSNFNFDMMIGLPGQTIANVSDTIDFFTNLEPTHISCYSLIVEEGTPLYEQVSHNTVVLPDEELERDMYHEAKQCLEDRGYHQYEISNFARDGYECRHNLDCWNREKYLGIGVAAASFLNNVRIKNPSTVSEYLSKAEPERVQLTPEDAQFESIMLGLRLVKGISDTDFRKQHHLSLTEAYGSVITRLIDQGLLQWEGEYLSCTSRGLDIQNEVLMEFMN